MSRVLAVLCLIVFVAAACGSDRPVLVAELRPEPSEPAADVVAEDDAGLAATAAGEPESAAEPASAGVAVALAVVGEPIFDPIRASVVDPQDMALVDLVTDGLTEWDPQRNTWAPSLAASVDTPDGGQTWRFVLGATTFSDGAAITAADVVRSFERVMADSFALPATRLEVVESVAAIGPLTVEFVLAEPFADFPALVSSPVYGIVPDGPIDGTIGSGPFVLDDSGDLVSDGLGLAFELVAVADEDTAVAAFEQGQLDLAFVGGAYAGPVQAAASAAIEVHFALNTASPDLQDLESRRVVVDAVSRTRVTNAAFGEGAGAVGRMVPAALACAAPCGGTLPEEPREIGPLRIAYVTEPSGREAALAEAVAAELAVAGIEATPEGFTLDDFVDHVSAGEHDLVRTGWVGLFPSAASQLAPYRSTSPDNVSGYTSPEFDDVLDAARTAGGAALYEDAQARLQDDAVVLPIARLRVRALVSDRIGSIELRHDGSIDLDSLRLAD